jgi:alpha-tubulin N-acetyltransferase 1
MEHPGVRRLTPKENGIAIISPLKSGKFHPEVSSLINQIGIASSRAQGLPHVITNFSTFVNSDNTIYMLISEDGKKALGFVKVGTRNLFLWDRRAVQHQKRCVCLLDFFTCPTCQRQGHGKKMIDAMLEDQGLNMVQVPIDRPSNLCLSFMKRHFGLCEYVAQSNNFVVFDQFWQSDSATNTISQYNSGRQPLLPILKRDNGRSNGVGILKAICIHPSRKTHYNPITWSIHPGVNQ